MLMRNAKVRDLEPCITLAQQEGETYWTFSDFDRSISNKNAIFLVAAEGDEIRGYITGFIVPTKANEAMIHETRTDLASRGKKIGTRLVEAFCDEAFRRGATVIYALIKDELKPFYLDACHFKETGHWIEASKT